MGSRESAGTSLALMIFGLCNFELGKWLRGLPGQASRAWKATVLRTTWAMEIQPKRFQKRTILAPGLETILVAFWQRLWLLFSLAPRSRQIEAFWANSTGRGDFNIDILTATSNHSYAGAQ